MRHVHEAATRLVATFDAQRLASADRLAALTALCTRATTNQDVNPSTPT